jgi:hypothetical protein
MSCRRPIALLLLVLYGQGCMTWKPSKLTPEQVVEKEGQIRVQLMDESKVHVQKPWIRGDTLGGKRLTVLSPSGKVPRAQAIPLDSVAIVETEELTTLSVVTLCVAAVPLVAMVAFVYLVACLDDPSGQACGS